MLTCHKHAILIMYCVLGILIPSSQPLTLERETPKSAASSFWEILFFFAAF